MWLAEDFTWKLPEAALHIYVAVVVVGGFFFFFLFLLIEMVICNVFVSFYTFTVDT